MKNTLTMGSLFDGSGGFPLSALIAGITPVWASEIEPFPIRVTTRRLPMMKHLGSITELDGGEIEPVDIITMGSPCFPAGTLILAEDGYKPIEKIRIGDKVLTHEGRWRGVTAIGSKMGTTIILKGNHYGLECTPNHPIYSAESRRSYPRLENGKRTSRVQAAEKREWIRAEDMVGRLWAVPNSFECLPLPREEEKSRATAHAMPIIDKDLMYLVGLWLGDGWVRDGQRSNRPEGQCWAQVIICASDKKLPDVERAFDSLGIRYKTSEGRTVYKVMASHKALCTFLTTHFGKHAEGKRIPSWALTLDRESRESLLKGVTDTDGYRIREDRVRINTVSKELAHGLRLLAESLGYSTTIYFNKQKPQQVIEGRMVSQRDVSAL